MTVHHFPGPADVLCFRIREASVDSRAWHSVVQDIEDRFPRSRCELVFRARDVSRSVVQLTGAGFRNHDMPRPSAEAFFTSDWPVGHVQTFDERAAGDEGLEGGSLLLARTGSGVWVLRLWSIRCLERRLGDAIVAFLTRLSPALVSAFRVSLDLECPRGPAGADLEASWDPLDYGVLLLTPCMRPRFANAMAEEFLGTRSLFRPSGRTGSLRAASDILQEDLETAADRIASGSVDRVDLALHEGDRRARLRLRLSKVGSGPTGWTGPKETGYRPPLFVMTMRERKVSLPLRFGSPDPAFDPRLASGF